MRIFACFCALTAVIPVASAFDLPPGDPEQLLRSSRVLASRVGSLPCTDQLPEAPLAVLDAVDMALCRHPQTRELWAAARNQAALLGVARATQWPSLDGRVGLTRQFARNGDYSQKTAGIDLSWLLFDSGQRSANIAASSYLLDAALATQDAGVQTIFLGALQAYYAAQAAQAAVLARQDAERAANESLAAAELRYQVGTATPADRLQAKTAASQAMLDRLRAEGEAKNAMGALSNALGLPAQQVLQLAALPAPPATKAFSLAVEQMIETAQESRPDLKAAAAQAQAANAAINAARAQGRPSISLSAGPGWQSLAGTEAHGGALGLTLKLPIFSGFDTRYRVRSAEAQAEVRTAQYDRIRQQVALEVWKAYQNLTTATQSLQATQDLLASAEQSAGVALGRYKAGVGNVLDLLTAQTALAYARVQRIQSELDWRVYRAVLAQAMGTLDYSLLQAAEGQP